jgi:hypothetical protein
MSRNPFGVRDVPDPDGADVTAFARGVRPTGPAGAAPAALEGRWSSRWNAGGSGWHAGRATIRVEGTRVHILFDWDDGAKQGLIEAREDGDGRLVGRYLNLSAPDITRPWIGQIVDAGRIDGHHSGGRIDFRR